MIMDKRDVPHVLVRSGGDTPQLQTQTVRCSRCLACDATLALQPPPAFLLLPPSPHSSSSTALVCPVTLANPCHLLHQVPGFLNGVIFIKDLSLHLCSEMYLLCFTANISIPISTFFLFSYILRSGRPYQTFSKPGKVMKCLCRSMLVASGHVLFLLNTQ